jgi:hypothetical protein
MLRHGRPSITAPRRNRCLHAVPPPSAVPLPELPEPLLCLFSSGESRKLMRKNRRAGLSSESGAALAPSAPCYSPISEAIGTAGTPRRAKYSNVGPTNTSQHLRTHAGHAGSELAARFGCRCSDPPIQKDGVLWGCSSRVHFRDSESMKHVESAVRKSRPNANIIAPKLPLGMFSALDANVVARQVLEEIESQSQFRAHLHSQLR